MLTVVGLGLFALYLVTRPTSSSSSSPTTPTSTTAGGSGSSVAGTIATVGTTVATIGTGVAAVVGGLKTAVGVAGGGAAAGGAAAGGAGGGTASIAGGGTVATGGGSGGAGTAIATGGGIGLALSTGFVVVLAAWAVVAVVSIIASTLMTQAKNFAAAVRLIYAQQRDLHDYEVSALRALLRETRGEVVWTEDLVPAPELDRNIGGGFKVPGMRTIIRPTLSDAVMPGVAIQGTAVAGLDSVAWRELQVQARCLGVEYCRRRRLHFIGLAINEAPPVGGYTEQQLHIPDDLVADLDALPLAGGGLLSTQERELQTARLRERPEFNAAIALRQFEATRDTLAVLARCAPLPFAVADPVGDVARLEFANLTLETAFGFRVSGARVAIAPAAVGLVAEQPNESVIIDFRRLKQGGGPAVYREVLS